jgi:hypothetical protein
MIDHSELINVIFFCYFLQVKKLCGAPSLHPTDRVVGTEVQAPPHLSFGNKWISPPDTQMLQFLVSLHKPTEFFMRIADRYVHHNLFIKLLFMQKKSIIKSEILFIFVR